MKVKILEAVGKVGEIPLIVGALMDVPEEAGQKMIDAAVAELAE
jgi:hypothetical protein